MNAGAWGGEIGNLVEAVTFVDRRGQVHEVGRQELEFSYRRMRPRSPELSEAVVVEALVLLTSGDRSGNSRPLPGVARPPQGQTARRRCLSRFLFQESAGGFGRAG